MARAGRPQVWDEYRKVPMRRDQVEAIRTIAAMEGVPQATVIRRAVDREIKRAERRRRAGAA